MQPDVTAALVYVLASWACAAFVTIWAYLAISVSRFATVLRAALVASAPGMFLGPAILLLARHTLPAELTGLATIAAVTLMLRLAPAPRRYEERKGGQVAESTASTVFGALILQCAVCALLWRRPVLAGAGLTIAAVVWTSSALARGLARPRSHSSPWSVPVQFAIAVTATVWLLRYAPVPARASTPWGIAEAVMQELREAPVDANKTTPESAQRATPVFSAKGTPAAFAKGVPGVIFRPPEKPKPAIVQPGAPAISMSPRKPARIPFTGEYQLFRTSSGRLPPGSRVYTGTPLDALYRSTNGSGIETEAEQQFVPAVDFARCSRVQLALANGEEALAFAAMQLVTPSGVRELDPALFGVHPGVVQNIDFDVPPSMQPVPVSAIRILFHSADPSRRGTTVKVAIQGFAFFGR
ncbi:MAG TPA: hypothetical protein VN736_15505 [Candidatus Limnocylindrales bacterium]|nr:hypothetical protein [Candidatus Limnocylindrales bacterium]